MSTADKLIEAGYPLWLVFFAIVLPFLVTLSKQLGGLNTVLGAANRRWQSRQERAVTKIMSVDEKIELAVSQRVEMQMAPIRESVDNLKQGLKASNDEVDKLRTKLNKALQEIMYRDEYALEQSRYIRYVYEWAAQEGHVIPTPPFRPAQFTEWLNEYLKKEKDQDGN